MNPTVLARFAPWFGRIVKSTPSLLANLVNRLKLAGKTVQPSVAGVIAFVKEHPVNAALVFTTLADLGVSLYHLFEGTTDEHEGKKLETRAVSVSDQVRSAALSTIIDVAAKSENLNTSKHSQTDVDVLKETCGYAKRFFGNRANALEAHAMLQAFFELPRGEVEFAFDNLRLDR